MSEKETAADDFVRRYLVPLYPADKPEQEWTHWEQSEARRLRAVFSAGFEEGRQSAWAGIGLTADAPPQEGT